MIKKVDELLEQWREKRLYRKMIRDLGSMDSAVREDAVVGLGIMRNRQAIGPLKKVLGDDDCEIRLSAAKALEDLRWEPETELEKAQYLIAQGRWTEAASVRPAALALLIAALEDDHWWDIRLSAAKALGGMGDPRAIPPLIAALEDRDARVCKRAAEALAGLRWTPGSDIEMERYLIALGPGAGSAPQRTPTLERLAASLMDPDCGVRMHAAEILGRLHDRRAVQPLRAALEDPDGRVRLRAVHGLYESGWKPKDEREHEIVLYAMGAGPHPDAVI